MKFFRAINGFIATRPLGWLVVGVLASVLFILALGCNLAPRDPHPERTPSPHTSCTTYSEGTGLVCVEVQQ